MEHLIKVAADVIDGTRALHLDQELSHHLDETQTQELLRRTERLNWAAHPGIGRQLGADLFALFDGGGRRLQDLTSSRTGGSEHRYLCFDLPSGLDRLPIELLYDQQFLALRRDVHIIRRVSDRHRLRQLVTEDRPLKMLFMACSPLDLVRSALDYEREEEAIFREMARFPIEFVVEDSGSLQGLQDALIQSNGFDVVHITGHAGHDERGPVFYMENEGGNLDKVTPHELARVLRDYPPRLLFLSGCSTGQSDQVLEAASFAFQAVSEQEGPACVLGWGLPVTDIGATRLSTELYKHLAQGKPLDFAVNRARRAVQEHHYPWPLLRLFSDGSSLPSLVAPGVNLNHRTERGTRYRALQDSRVRVLEYGFVGRRRQIQQGVRVLKGWHDEHAGVLIRGPAGVGKSCLAGKLSERVKDKQLIVLHGVLNKIELLTKLRRLFDRVGLQSGLDALQAELEYPDRVKQLFRTALQELPTILVLDDFEQNLVPRGDGWTLTPEAIEFIKPILEALSWHQEQQVESNLLITSRYPFEIEVDGRDLAAAVLEDITLSSFRGPDLEKKKQELPHIVRSAHTDLYLEWGCGNPRLLDWLEKIAERETDYDLEALRKQLAGKSEEFVREYLAEIIARTQGEPFERFFRRAAVYRQPVPESAFAALGETDLLEVGVDLTLFEKEQFSAREAVYWVMPVIRDQAWGKLAGEEQLRLHQLAFTWYDQQLNEQETKDPEYLSEAVHHALASGNIRAACKHAITLGAHLNSLLLYREKLHLQQQVADRIDERVTREAIAARDDSVPTLLNNLGETLRALGDARQAIGFYEQALENVQAMFADQHPNVASSYNNLGEAWRALGDARRAIGFYEQALKIDRAVFGDQHPRVAIRYNNLGAAWRDLGDARQAIDFYEQALKIFRAVFGDQHPNVSNSYNNLGEAWCTLGDARQAIGLYEQALEIDRAVFGDQHPNVAVSYNNLGEAWRDLGDARHAIAFYEQALEIDRAVFGDQHPNVARSYNNLGAAWRDLGDLRQAIKFYEQALRIDRAVFGDQHPNVARSYNNLGAAWRDLGDARQGIKFYEQALRIDRAVFGDQHLKVAIRYSNLGAAWHDLGDARQAIGFYEQALEIDRAVFGDQHPKVAIHYSNLGGAWHDLGDARQATAFYEQALKIDRAVFGDQHPNVARSYNNLGGAWHDLGDARQAIGFFEQALEIDRAVFGDQHPNVAISYNNLGAAWRDLGDARQAIAFYEQALKIDRAVFGDQHPNVARSYNNLGAAWRDLGDARQAIDLYEQALKMDRTVFGDQHPKVAIRYNNLGMARRDLGDVRQAIGNLEQALQILTKLYGSDHPSTKTVRENLQQLRE